MLHAIFFLACLLLIKSHHLKNPKEELADLQFDFYFH